MRLPLLAAHPGHRLVEQEQLRLLDQQHADLEPLLLPVAQLPRRRRAVRVSPMRLERLRHLGEHAGAWRSNRGKRRRNVAARSRFSITLSCLEHRRRLEAATDPEPHDPVLLHAADRASPNEDLAALGFREPGDAVDEVVFPAPFGPMRKRNSPSFTTRSTPSSALNPSKLDREVAQLEHGNGHAPSR